jgi:hypothetical protein
MMASKKFTNLETQFLTLHDDYGLAADDLAHVFGIPPARARQILGVAKTKDAECCHRLLDVVLGGRR